MPIVHGSCDRSAKDFFENANRLTFTVLSFFRRPFFCLLSFRQHTTLLTFLSKNIMSGWYARDLPLQTGLARATTHLEDARNNYTSNSKDNDRECALKYCYKAKESLERINISKSTPLDLDQIIAKYLELGAVLDKLGFGDEARLSYRKAKELR